MKDDPITNHIHAHQYNDIRIVSYQPVFNIHQQISSAEPFPCDLEPSKKLQETTSWWFQT